MKTEMLTIETLAEDQTRREAVRARVEAEHRVEALEADLKALKLEPGRLAPTLQLLKIQESLLDARAGVSTAQAYEAAAKSAAVEKVKAARRPEDRRLLQERLTALRAACAADLAYRRHRAETAALCGIASAPDVAPLPLEGAIAAIERALAGPAPAIPAPPPRPGEVRLRLTIDSFHDREANRYVLRGDVFDLAERDARELLKTGGAVEVAGA